MLLTEKLKHMLSVEAASTILILEPPSADLLVEDEQGPRLLLSADSRRVVRETLMRVFHVPNGSWVQQATDPVHPLQGWDVRAVASLLWRVCGVAAARLSHAQMASLLKEGVDVEQKWWLHVTHVDEEGDLYAGLGLSEASGGAALMKMIVVAWHDGTL